MARADARLFKSCACGRTLPLGKRKCARCLKTKNFKVIKGRPVNKGRNATGIAAHKPDRSYTRRPKRQHPENLGLEPRISATNWRYV